MPASRLRRTPTREKRIGTLSRCDGQQFTGCCCSSVIILISIAVVIIIVMIIISSSGSGSDDSGSGGSLSGKITTEIREIRFVCPRLGFVGLGLDGTVT